MYFGYYHLGSVVSEHGDHLEEVTELEHVETGNHAIFR